MIQPGLFDDICSGRHGGNAESQEAHESVRELAPKLRMQVLSFIQGLGPYGASIEEVSLGLGMRYTTASARCSELRAAGRIWPSGLRRPTTSGRKAAVLVAV